MDEPQLPPPGSAPESGAPAGTAPAPEDARGTTSHPEIEALWQGLSAEPWRFDLFAVLRRLQALHAERPRFGRAPRPSMEPLRIGQEPSSAFAPRALASAGLRGALPPKLRLFGFGLFGPNGPLPLTLTEYAHERAIHAGDRTLTEFADLFHHRFGLLFFRAWADAQSTASLDRAGEDDFSRWLSSLIGHGLPVQREGDRVPRHARLNHAGHLVRLTRNAEGLARILGNFFDTPARVLEHIGHWLPLPREQRSRLGVAAGSQLGRDAVAGAAVWDRQYRFRIVLGPMPLAQYLNLLPGAKGALQLRDWVRSYVGLEYDFDLELTLAAADVEGARLGGQAQLGWSSWLSPSGPRRPRADLSYRPETHPAHVRAERNGRGTASPEARSNP